ncbi:hypothetical protein ATE92_1292 [Ulvibacter sp. MAR_2010_11]|uniref:hypothetical protein n=1 Tax=Ulvibacter sp. MAR_2010_11 TaxID=1250229 RepID=UPI000C2B9148|nr:hypothetical protein [Ulvibacter sp. MAR_2010_11]PKA83144.1 hypothetical protein ATE92_1292 [Ulvibacter sp. MAR_2010_11]
MKKVLIAAFVFAACLSCENPVTKKIKETKENVSNTTKAVKELNKMQDDIEDLQKQEPLTNEELKAWLPESIDGMKRTSYKAGETSFVSIASVSATYANEDKSRQFKVEVIDGAGQFGAAATAGMRMLMSQDFEEEDENQIRKTVKKNGVKAVEEYQKNNNRSSIEFMQGNRFYIKATGINMNIDDTWDAIDDLNTKDLE